MKRFTRRAALKMLTAAPVAAGFVWTAAEADAASVLTAAARQVVAKGGAFQPKFFTPHEWATVRVLVDILIPRDERSGSATDAGVPEFMDFMMLDQPLRQTAMRGGLAWLDRECERQFDKRFLACADVERTTVLDQIAWPARAAIERAHGVAFFNSFRDLAAAGFWTSRVGIADLQYLGNRSVAQWRGCPDEALKRLGVSYPP